MSGKRAAIALILALLAFGYVFTLNPGGVDFQIYPGTRVKTSLALVLFLFFLAGLGVAVLVTAFKEALRSFFFWRHVRGDERQREARQLLLRGRSQVVLGNTKTARKLLQRAYRKTSGEFLIELEMARVDLADGRFERAERRLRALLEQDARNPEVLSLFLDLYAQRGDFEGQVTVLRRWLEADPDHMGALRSLRDLYSNAGHWQEAARAQERIVARAEARGVRAAERRLLLELRFRHAAKAPRGRGRAMFEQLVREEPEFSPGHAALGDELLASGDPDGAVRVWLHGYDATAHPGLLLRAEKVRLDEGRGEDMLKLYRKLARRGAIPSLLRVRLLLILGRAEEALELLEGDKSEAAPGLRRLLLAETLYQVRSYDESARMFRESAFGAEGIPLSFACQKCGARDRGWDAQCPSCHAIDTLRLQTESEPVAPAGATGSLTR